MSSFLQLWMSKFIQKNMQHMAHQRQRSSARFEKSGSISCTIYDMSQNAA